MCQHLNSDKLKPFNLIEANLKLAFNHRLSLYYPPYEKSSLPWSNSLNLPSASAQDLLKTKEGTEDTLA